MKVKYPKEIRVVAGLNPAEFEKTVNKIFLELADEDIKPELHLFEGEQLTAVIVYDRVVKIAENEKDRYNLQGIYAYCIDCEQFTPSSDGRHKCGYCRMHSKSVRKDASACTDYYLMKDRWQK